MSAKPSWSQDFERWQRVCRAAHARSDSIGARIDFQIRRLAASCGFDPALPMLTANNWADRIGQTKCATRMRGLEQTNWLASQAATRACTRAWNTILADRHGVARSTEGF